MICEKCGMENAAGAKFCARCGVTIESEPAECLIAESTPPVEAVETPEVPVQMPAAEMPKVQEPMVEEPIFSWESEPYVQMQVDPMPAAVWTPRVNVQPKVEPKPVKKKKKLLWPILIGVLVLLIGTAAALYFTGVFDSLLGKKEEVKEENISGYYVLQSAQVNGEALAEKELVWNDYALFLLLNDDQTAVFFNGSALIDCTYENGELKPTEGASMAYRVEKDTLTLTTAEGTFVFQKSDDPAPNLDELKEALETPMEIGYFKFVSAKLGEEEYAAEDLSGEDSFLLLYEDGTGIFYTEMIQDMRWEDGLIYPDGDKENAMNYSVDKEGIEMFADSEGEFSYYFERSDETPPDIEKLREELSLPGYYIMSEMTLDGETISISDFKETYESMGMYLPFLLIHEDGSAVMYLGTRIEDMQCDDTSIWPVDTPNEKVEYQLSGGILIIENVQMKMVFERSDEEAPDIEKLREELKEPQNENPSDADLTGEYELYAYDMGSGLTETSGAMLILNADGTGTLADSIDVTWSANNMKVGSIVYTYEFDENGNLVLEGSDGKFCFKPIGKTESRWSGDWYGFWMVTDCTGDMASYNDQWWDLCARSTDNGDGTCTITFWDEDYNSIDDPIGIIEFKILDNGAIESNDGWFYMDSVSNELNSEATLATSDDMLMLEGTYTDEDCSYTYTICLRPWGTRWDDLAEEMLPYHYKDWYLPLIEAGEDMPDVFETP